MHPVRSFPAWRVGSSCLLLAICAVSNAEITYNVHPDLQSKTLLITMDVPVKGDSLSVQMPRWGPGGYDYGDYGKEVTGVMMMDTKGNTLAVDHPDFSTWTASSVAKGHVTVSYSVKAEYANDVLHYSGPSTYLYVVGRTQEPCKLTLDFPADWPIAIGLNNYKNAQNIFTAPTYDVLADNPVSAGHYYSGTYTVNGKMHYIALRGTPDDVNAIDKVKLHKVTNYISAMEANFFGGEPYDHYVWHITAFKRPDGGWGLEHLASTQIGLATGFGMNTDSVLAHELFHAWNVKRIRSRVLGPFDYTTLPKTGALWWLEGVTDYYADTLLRRYNWTDDPRYYFVIARNVSGVRGNPERLNISPYDSSYRVNEANGGRGNSNGLGVSYYNTGWLVGLCLDMEIRSKTDGRKSLDDVERNLFRKYGHDGQAGFAEDGIRKELVNVGGPSLGTMYDQIVMKPGELPVEEALTKVGLRLYQKDETYANIGFKTSFNMEAKGLNVNAPEAFTTLKGGDIIVGVNGTLFKDVQMGQAMGLMSPISSPEAGKVVHLTVQRAGVTDPMQIDVTAIAASRKTWVVDEDPSASMPTVALRKSWLTPPAGWMPPSQ